MRELEIETDVHLLSSFSYRCALRALQWFSDNQEGLLRCSEALARWHRSNAPVDSNDPVDATLSEKRAAREILRQEEYRAWQHWDAARHLSEGMEMRLRGMWEAVRATEAAMLHNASEAAIQCAQLAREAAMGWWSYQAWREAQARWENGWGEMGKQWASEMAAQGARPLALARELQWQEELLRQLLQKRKEVHHSFVRLLLERKERLLQGLSSRTQLLEERLFSE